MPVGLRWGMVTSVADGPDGLLRLEVDGEPCLAYPRLTGPVEVGDMVLVNHQARAIGLAGAADVLAVNLTRGLRLPGGDGAHGLAWPFAPAQLAVRYAEEEASELPARVDGLVVVCCGLHEQLVPVCAALRGRRVAYVQLGGGALPVSLSDAVRALRARHMLETTIAVAPCVDADLECVTFASALAVAAARGIEIVVAGIGPGVVTTRSRLGHGGLSVADAANATAALGGASVIAPCVSSSAPGGDDHGLSPRTRSALELCLGEVVVAWPNGLDAPPGLAVTAVDVTGWREACAGLPLAHEGRGPEDDPWFFASSFAAGVVATAARGSSRTTGSSARSG